MQVTQKRNQHSVNSKCTRHRKNRIRNAVTSCKKLNGKTLCIESSCQGFQEQIQLLITLRFLTDNIKETTISKM